ncbi:hypothetical protein GCM10011344_10980 [Dokdonia pacifica]|nr:hypothetical protein GCM10011344_10980 [Dokdonia pacifica]
MIVNSSAMRINNFQSGQYNRSYFPSLFNIIYIEIPKRLAKKLKIDFKLKDGILKWISRFRNCEIQGKAPTRKASAMIE